MTKRHTPSEQGIKGSTTYIRGNSADSIAKAANKMSAWSMIDGYAQVGSHIRNQMAKERKHLTQGMKGISAAYQTKMRAEDAADTESYTAETRAGLPLDSNSESQLRKVIQEYVKYYLTIQPAAVALMGHVEGERPLKALVDSIIEQLGEKSPDFLVSSDGGEKSFTGRKNTDGKVKLHPTLRDTTKFNFAALVQERQGLERKDRILDMLDVVQELVTNDDPDQELGTYMEMLEENRADYQKQASARSAGIEKTACEQWIEAIDTVLNVLKENIKDTDSLSISAVGSDDSNLDDPKFDLGDLRYNIAHTKAKVVESKAKSELASAPAFAVAEAVEKGTRQWVNSCTIEGAPQKKDARGRVEETAGHASARERNAIISASFITDTRERDFDKRDERSGEIKGKMVGRSTPGMGKYRSKHRTHTKNTYGGAVFSAWKDMLQEFATYHKVDLASLTAEEAFEFGQIASEVYFTEKNKLVGSVAPVVELKEATQQGLLEELQGLSDRHLEEQIKATYAGMKPAHVQRILGSKNKIETLEALEALTDDLDAPLYYTNGDDLSDLKTLLRRRDALTQDLNVTTDDIDALFEHIVDEDMQAGDKPIKFKKLNVEAQNTIERIATKRYQQGESIVQLKENANGILVEPICPTSFADKKTKSKLLQANELPFSAKARLSKQLKMMRPEDLSKLAGALLEAEDGYGTDLIDQQNDLGLPFNQAITEKAKQEKLKDIMLNPKDGKHEEILLKLVQHRHQNHQPMLQDEYGYNKDPDVRGYKTAKVPVTAKAIEGVKEGIKRQRRERGANPRGYESEKSRLGDNIARPADLFTEHSACKGLMEAFKARCNDSAIHQGASIDLAGSRQGKFAHDTREAKEKQRSDRVEQRKMRNPAYQKPVTPVPSAMARVERNKREIVDLDGVTHPIHEHKKTTFSLGKESDQNVIIAPNPAKANLQIILPDDLSAMGKLQDFLYITDHGQNVFSICRNSNGGIDLDVENKTLAKKFYKTYKTINIIGGHDLSHNFALDQMGEEPDPVEAEVEPKPKPRRSNGTRKSPFARQQDSDSAQSSRPKPRGRGTVNATQGSDRNREEDSGHESDGGRATSGETRRPATATSKTGSELLKAEEVVKRLKAKLAVEKMQSLEIKLEDDFSDQPDFNPSSSRDGTERFAHQRVDVLQGRVSVPNESGAEFDDQTDFRSPKSALRDTSLPIPDSSSLTQLAQPDSNPSSSRDGTERFAHQRVDVLQGRVSVPNESGAEFDDQTDFRSPKSALRDAPLPMPDSSSLTQLAQLVMELSSKVGELTDRVELLTSKVTSLEERPEIERQEPEPEPGSRRQSRLAKANSAASNLVAGNQHDGPQRTTHALMDGLGVTGAREAVNTASRVEKMEVSQDDMRPKPQPNLQHQAVTSRKGVGTGHQVQY